MPVDQGALGGLVQGLREGLGAYTQELQRKRELEAKGYTEDPASGRLMRTPEFLAEEKRKLDNEATVARTAHEYHMDEQKNAAAAAHQNAVDLENLRYKHTSGEKAADGRTRLDEEAVKSGQAYFNDKGGLIYGSRPGNLGGYKPDKDTIKNEMQLRDDFTKSPQYKDASTVSTAFRKVVSSGQMESAAGDMAMIFGYMKLLDPGSTVREGEYASAEQARGVPDSVLGLYNRAKAGQRLTPQQRQDFINASKRQYSAQLDGMRQLKELYTNSAKRYGGDPAFIIPELEDAEKIMAAYPAKKLKASAPAPKAKPDFNSMSTEELRKYVGE